MNKQDLDLIHDEETRYTDIYKKIVEQSHTKTNELQDNQNLARDITKAIVNTRRDEDKQALQSDESVAHGLARLRLKQSKDLAELLKQPYFARVIYNEKGRNIEFKLGLASFPEARIVDWRKAPISKLYYDYNEGDEYDDEIAGVERFGSIKLKRAYRGQHDILASIELKDWTYVKSRGEWHKQRKGQKTTFTLKDREKIKELMRDFNDNKITESDLGGGYLHNVLSLLTPEQFRLISTEDDRPVIIQGSAGTGKTTVALHRLAWLMFEGNSKAKAENTLVVMFNQSLASYVRHVLPELGIHNIKIVTFSEWAKDILKTVSGHEWDFQNEDIPAEVARFKAHHNTLTLLEKVFARNLPGDDLKQEIFDFYQSDLVVNSLNAQPDGSIIKAYLKNQQQTGQLDSYDTAYLLHILHRRDNSYRSTRFPVFLDYLLVDEAQDFTIVELKALFHALEDKRYFTMAGDLGQKILENRDFGTWTDLLSELGLDNVDVINLNVAYRSTYQIYELAEFVRDPETNEEDLQLTPKFGPEPKLYITHTFGDAIDKAKDWIEEVSRLNRETNGAILCATPQEARSLFDALIKRGVHGIRHGDAQHFEFTPGITITDVKQIKGLEFANVLLFNPSENHFGKNDLKQRNTLYVAISRAEWRLDLICYDQASSLLPDFIEIEDLTKLEETDDKPLFSDTDQDTSRFEIDEKDEDSHESYLNDEDESES